MPPTSVYLVLPASMAWIAASLMLAGVSKSGSPAPRPMTLRPAAFQPRALFLYADVAAGRFQRTCFIRHRDRRGRLHTVERSGQERHHHLLAGKCEHTTCRH